MLDLKNFETLKDTQHVDVFLKESIVTLNAVDSKELIRLAIIGLEHENTNKINRD